MDYFKIFLSSLLSLSALFLSTKIIGNKQMSQLNMFDYINGITIGSIAADMAINLESNILFPIIAISVYTGMIALIAFVGSKCVAARRALTGKSILLMDKGEMFYGNFKTAKIDLNEFFTQCRINGYFDPDDIETAILEQNGVISFMPRSDARPATPADLKLVPGRERPFYCVISDGNILGENLNQSGMTLAQLNSALNSRRLGVSDVFAALTDGNSLRIFPKLTKAPKNDIAQ